MEKNTVYKRTYRPNSNGDDFYIQDECYSSDPSQHIRVFLLIQEDLKSIFEYIEPSDNNLSCYSHRIYSLFVRTCTAVEANFKAIFRDNNYHEKKNKKGKTTNWTIKDYQLIDRSHFLSRYQIDMPYWKGEYHSYIPFEYWGNSNGIDWYKSYNEVKHDVANQLYKANFKNLILSISGLAVLITAQFNNQTFAKKAYSHKGGMLFEEAYEQGKWEHVTGDFFRVKKPTNIDSYYITEKDKIEFVNFPYE